MHPAHEHGLLDLGDEGTVPVTHFRTSKRYRLYLRGREGAVLDGSVERL